MWNLTVFELLFSRRKKTKTARRTKTGIQTTLSHVMTATTEINREAAALLASSGAAGLAAAAAEAVAVDRTAISGRTKNGKRTKEILRVAEVAAEAEAWVLAQEAACRTGSVVVAAVLAGSLAAAAQTAVARVAWHRTPVPSVK